MKRISDEDRAGLYITVTVHLAVLIVMLAVGLDFSLKRENTFVLDFTKFEEKERMLEEIEKLRKEVELRQAISEKLEREIGSVQPIRNVAVDRAALKDDRGTDAKQLYKDAERLQKELENWRAEEEESITAPGEKKDVKEKKEEKQTYSGPSVVSYLLEGRKANKLPIPAYRCIGAGEVTVLITVDNSGSVTGAKVDESCSSADGCLRAFAIRAARLSKFSASSEAPPKQNGNIVYKFIAQ